MQIYETILRFIIDAVLAFLCIPIHELGHYFSARMLGLKAKLVMKRNMVWHNAETDMQRIIVTCCGIIIGLIPILFISDLFLKTYILIAYLVVGCALDNIKLLRITSYYLNISIPNWILTIEQVLRRHSHHKYCPCRGCSDYLLSQRFQFRS